MQLAGSFFSSDLYQRMTNNVGTTAWNKIWTSGNDGPASGLDADTVDTYHVGTSGAAIPLCNGANTFSGITTFSALTNTFGNNAGNATSNLGSGFTTSGNTKAINIGTNGLTGSTTNINIGSINSTNTIKIYGDVLQSYDAPSAGSPYPGAFYYFEPQSSTTAFGLNSPYIGALTNLGQGVTPQLAISSGANASSSVVIYAGNSAYNWSFRGNGEFGVQGQIQSSVATGTAPFTVASTTLVTNLNADLLDGRHLDTLTATLRANRNISGGGTITVDGTGNNVSWNARFIVIANGMGAHFSTNGYFDIDCPTSGSITVVGGTPVTATAAGVPLTAWQALYYILPIGSASNFIAANLRIVPYNVTATIPDEWVLVCIRNGDNGRFYFNNGISLAIGQSINTAVYDAYNVALLNGYQVGTSGSSIPLFNGTNSWSGDQVFTNPIKLNTTTAVAGTYNLSTVNLQSHGNTPSIAGCTFGSWHNGTNSPAIEFIKSRAAGVVGNAGTLNSGDNIAQIIASGYDATAGTNVLRESSAIRMMVSAAPTAGFTPGKISFWTSSATVASTERVVIDSTGILPIANVTYDLGSSTNYWRDTYSEEFATPQVSNHLKYKLWANDSSYALGMVSDHTFGPLGPTDGWAMTFRFSSGASRGFWWGNSSHTTAQGAMALSSDGNLYVAKAIRVGYAESDTTDVGSWKGKLDVRAADLGTVAGNEVLAQTITSGTTNESRLEVAFVRTSAGTDWTTCGTRIQAKTDVTWQSFIDFNGGGNNAGISFGTGNSTTNSNSVPVRVKIDSTGLLSALNGLSVDNGFRLLDSSTNYLTIASNSALTQARTVTFDFNNATRTITFPGTTALTLAGISNTQTLTNKTITYADNTLTGVAGTGVSNTFTANQSFITTAAASVITLGNTGTTGTTCTITGQNFGGAPWLAINTGTNDLSFATITTGGSVPKQFTFNSDGSFGIQDASQTTAIAVQFAANSSVTLTANRKLTFDVLNAARTVKLAGNLDIANNLTTSGNFALTLTATAATNVTLPTTGTLATRAGTETLTNKTFGSNSYTTTQTLTVANDFVFISAAAAWTLTLPTPTAGKSLYITRTDATAFIISVTGHINGTAATTNTTWFPVSTGNRRVLLISNGTSWYPMIAGTAA
jgi:hypothetical protein